jgi:hypothetical protein
MNFTSEHIYHIHTEVRQKALCLCNSECLQNSIKQCNSETIMNASVFLLFIEKEMLIFRKFQIKFKGKCPPNAFQYVSYNCHNQISLTNTETSHIQVRDHDNGYIIFSFQVEAQFIVLQM